MSAERVDRLQDQRDIANYHSLHRTIKDTFKQRSQTFDMFFREQGVIGKEQVNFGAGEYYVPLLDFKASGELQGRIFRVKKGDTPKPWTRYPFNYQNELRNLIVSVSPSQIELRKHDKYTECRIICGNKTLSVRIPHGSVDTFLATFEDILPRHLFPARDVESDVRQKIYTIIPKSTERKVIQMHERREHSSDGDKGIEEKSSKEQPKLEMKARAKQLVTKSITRFQTHKKMMKLLTFMANSKKIVGKKRVDRLFSDLTDKAPDIIDKVDEVRLCIRNFIRDVQHTPTKAKSMAGEYGKQYMRLMRKHFRMERSDIEKQWGVLITLVKFVRHKALTSLKKTEEALRSRTRNQVANVLVTPKQTSLQKVKSFFRKKMGGVLSKKVFV